MLHEEDRHLVTSLRGRGTTWRPAAAQCGPTPGVPAPRCHRDPVGTHHQKTGRPLNAPINPGGPRSAVITSAGSPPGAAPAEAPAGGAAKREQEVTELLIRLLATALGRWRRPCAPPRLTLTFGSLSQRTCLWSPSGEEVSGGGVEPDGVVVVVVMVVVVMVVQREQ
ncbi:unnamed protein product [Pleuronectes platessa]|uniref:Uncharacterized protein n=1 Tax=Pleuronectes platessa TaxID=8262 RepID=A0A9N7YEI5_PLEPL|nr:unnamed protein product [Pleuronectes platessa]